MLAHGLVAFPDGILRPLPRRDVPAPEHAVAGGAGA
jgi:hypothetical protein